MRTFGTHDLLTAFKDALSRACRPRGSVTVAIGGFRARIGYHDASNVIGVGGDPR
jgi:hypothetical protein